MARCQQQGAQGEHLVQTRPVGGSGQRQQRADEVLARVRIRRYVLAELDSESDLLRIVLVEARARPDLMDDAVDQLVRATFGGFAAWLRRRAGLTAERADAVAAVGLGALFSARLLRLLLGRDPIGVPDDVLVETWVRMVRSEIDG